MSDPPAHLAALLQTSHSAIMDAFVRRVAGLAPRPMSRSELVNHLPIFLDDIARALSSHMAGTAVADVIGPPARAHGEQRDRIGYHIDMVVREYGVLSDCVFDRIAESGLAPSLGELRVMTDCFAAAIADVVAGYTATRSLASDDERRHLVELLEQSPGFVAFLRGPELRFELANAAYYQTVGHRVLIGKTVREALPELVNQGFFEVLDRVLATGEPFVGRGVPIQLQRDPGAPLVSAVLDFIYQPIRAIDGSLVGVLVQGHEVTDAHREATQRLAAEAALRASEERYRTLFAAIDDGFCLIQVLYDASGAAVDYRFLEANQAFAHHTGLAGVVGKTVREVVPNQDASWFARYAGVAATGEPARFENEAPAMDRWFDVYANRAGDPALRQVAVVLKDVTARKQAELENARLLELERDARKEAEAASQLRDQFLATVSHELRTPLAAILGWVQMLRGHTLPPEKRDRALETIERNARAQAQLIEDLLDVSRILAGQLRIEVEPVEIKQVIEAALETVRPAALARDVRLVDQVAPGVVVTGDAARLQQVVWNLLSNAVKFTPQAGVVRVDVRVGDTEVEIAVVDTGKGIAAAFQPFVFDRFRQADGAISRSHGGLGLGLSIVRELVQLHGGTVDVFSEGEGRGTTFTVRLPLAVGRRRISEPRTAVSVSGPHPLACPPELAGMRIVVVDDETDTRDMLHTLLGHCGVVVVPAASAAEALAAVRSQPPDLLLSDIGMPGEDGYALIAQVRALAADAGGHVPAVALTAYARSEDRSRALRAGFDNHVAKPVEPAELLAVIASFARRRRG